MFPIPVALLQPNTFAYETQPMVKPTGFREYDARWLFGSELNLLGVQALGLGLATVLGEMGVKPELVTGHDYRAYSQSIKQALIVGLMAGTSSANWAKYAMGDRHRPMSCTFTPPAIRPTISACLIDME